LHRIRNELRDDNWFVDCEGTIRDALASLSFAAPQVLCLGLGSPATSQNARAQLAFLIETCQRFNVDNANISIYDPVFTAEDNAILNELGVRVLTENRKGNYLLNKPTICFMPHCDMELYEALLQSNWGPERIPNLFLVANRLADYVDSRPNRLLVTKAPCILRLAPIIECLQLPPSTRWPTAFNNLAIQFIQPFKTPQDTWFAESCVHVSLTS